MATPVVYLIGAGPGDPGLITVKGLDVRRRRPTSWSTTTWRTRGSSRRHARTPRSSTSARRASPSTSRRTRSTRSSSRRRSRTAARSSRASRAATRSSSAEAARRRSRWWTTASAFEVVPGVSSGYAAPAYAGIPVTHRGITTDMAFVTGHEDPTKETSDVNWDKLATAVGTICFFMGIKNLPEISSRLIENGRPATTPVALVRWGTTPRQEVLTGTLADIAEKAAAVHFKAPAITVVGEVVKLREQLKWFEDKPLFGKTIVVTRSRAQASELTDRARRARRRGARVPDDPRRRPGELRAAGRGHPQPRGLPLGRVHVGQRRREVLRPPQGGRAWTHAPWRTRGSPPSGRRRPQRCAAAGIVPDYVPTSTAPRASSRASASVASARVRGVLIPRALEAREVLPDTLRERGAAVDVVPAYRTVLGERREQRARSACRKATVDVVTFTSSSTVKNFVKLAEGMDLAAAMSDVLVASIGPDHVRHGAGASA